MEFLPAYGPLNECFLDIQYFLNESEHFIGMANWKLSAPN